jgi:hypothetical protein
MAEKSALHLVWDWNGTVLNDFDVSFRSTNSSFRDAGLPEITTATYRALLRSPIRGFYAAVLDRDPSDEECDFLDRTFHAYYLLYEKEAAPSSGLPHLFRQWHGAGCQVADHYGRGWVDLQPREVGRQVLLLRMRRCRTLDEREERCQPVPVRGSETGPLRRQARAARGSHAASMSVHSQAEPGPRASSPADAGPLGCRPGWCRIPPGEPPGAPAAGISPARSSRTASARTADPTLRMMVSSMTSLAGADPSTRMTRGRGPVCRTGPSRRIRLRARCVVQDVSCCAGRAPARASASTWANWLGQAPGIPARPTGPPGGGCPCCPAMPGCPGWQSAGLAGFGLAGFALALCRLAGAGLIPCSS